jgi:hypothetical protein
LGGPLQTLCPTVPPYFQDGHHRGALFNIGHYGKLFQKSSHQKLLGQLSPLQFDFWTKDNVVLTQHNAD